EFLASRRRTGRLGAGSRGCGVEEDVEVVGMDGAELCFFAVDVAAADQRGQGILERERAFLLGDGNFLMQMLERVAANAIAGAVADHQELGSGNAATVFFRQ